ncbi:MAG: efflux RND transporter permease subunit [Saprospiraceae bacterium]|nr:efflux RND transporter permease subunit [Saprospiraceae bacterium]MDZ4703693.1 efflux RND transporter permease subunit [Saprospiraceae bacterium]
MKISEFSVKNYQFTLIMFVMAILVGISALLNMPRSEDPNIESPYFAVVAVYPGAGPQDMEELVVDPLESALSELEDVKTIIADISDGLASIRVDFKYNVDVNEKYQEVVRTVNSMRGELPQELYALETRRFRPSDVNILQVALVSETASYQQMEEQAERLEKALEKVKNLKNIESWGYPDQQVRVSLRLEQIAQQGIPINNVLGAIQSENVNIPGGNVWLNSRKFNVKTSGSYEDVEEIRNTIVYSSGSKVVYLRDVAEVEYGYGEESHLTRLDGKRAVFLTAALKEGENISNIKEKYQPILDDFSQNLPGSVQLVKNFDQTESVDRRLKGLGRDFIIAILLVSITLLPLGIRAASIVMVSIPLSLFMGLTFLDLLGYNINQLSIVGLVVALGILVDDSIVVVENIERWMREGLPKRLAAIEATKQIGLAVVGCTATLILAFVPLVFLPEASGEFIRSLPMAVITTVLASLLVSLTIVPFLASRVLATNHNPEGNLFMRLLKRGISGSYSKMLVVALRWPKVSLLVAGAIFAGVLALAPLVGFSLFPRSEKPQFLVNITAAPGSNLYETDRITRDVEAKLKAYPEIKHQAVNVGHGNPRIYYNVIPEDDNSEFAQLFVQLQEDTETEEKVKLIDHLRKEFSDFPNAKIEVKDFEQGPPVEAPVAIRVFGENMDTLRNLAFQVEDMIRATEGSIYVTNPLQGLKTNLRVRINKDKSSLLGVPTSEIDRTVRLAIAGLQLGSFNDDGGTEYVINVSIPKGTHSDLSVFDNLYVNNVQGQAIPLKQLADIAFETSPPVIRHYDKQRFVTITSFVKTGHLAQTINTSMIEKLDRFPFPDGYRYVAAGEIEAQEQSFGGMGSIIIVTVFAFIAVLVLEFRTFKSTLIVLSVIPLGIIGAILALLITGNTFSFVAVVGLIALVGIEVKNSILLVDFTNQLRSQGYELDAAIREAGEIRFVPIVLTSLTAIGGLLPIALENNPLYTPLAWVIIGGLISSTLLSRIVTPVVYKLIPPRVETGEVLA